MTNTGAATALLFFLALAPSSSRAQDTTLVVVRIVDQTALTPIPNSEVEVNDGRTKARRLADSAGIARIRITATGQFHVRVRQLGFAPVERTVEVADALPARDSLVIALQRLAYALPPVSTTEERRCATLDSAASLSAAAALEQLRLAADRYQDFRTQYPFHASLERRTITLNDNGKPRSVRVNKEDAPSKEWGDPYVPREVLHDERVGFSVSLLFVSALADSAFWARHCFTVRGMASIADQRVVRMDFRPADGITDVDWRGTVSIDSATSMLRRIDFQLAGLPNDGNPRRLEGYTTFTSPSPFVSVPDSTIAIWWRRDSPRAVEGQHPDVVQLLRLAGIRFDKARPP